MVDMESHYHPPSPLDESVLGSPLCTHGDFMDSMEELQDISKSIHSDTLSSLDIHDYQPSSNGSEGSTVLGELLLSLISVLKNYGVASVLFFSVSKAAQCNNLVVRVGGFLQFNPLIPTLLQLNVHKEFT